VSWQHYSFSFINSLSRSAFEHQPSWQRRSFASYLQKCRKIKLVDCSTLPHYNLKIEDANFSRIRLMTWKYAMRCRDVRWNFPFPIRVPITSLHLIDAPVLNVCKESRGEMLLVSQDFPRKPNSGKELCRGKLTSILPKPLQDIASFHLKLLCILSHGKPARFGLTRSWVGTSLGHLVIERPRFRYYPHRDPLGFVLKALLSPSQYARTEGDQHSKSGMPRPSNHRKL
jgi:hypothetical protein